jgi:hypothetical protein
MITLIKMTSEEKAVIADRKKKADKAVAAFDLASERYAQSRKELWKDIFVSLFDKEESNFRLEITENNDIRFVGTKEKTEEVLNLLHTDREYDIE